MRGREETLGGNGYVYGLGSGDGFLGVYLSPNSRNYIHYICMTFYMSIIPQLSGKKNPQKIR